MNMKKEWLFLLVLICSGCASAPPLSPPLFSGVIPEKAPLCFSSNSEIPSIVQKFFASRDLTTEEGKIDYLLNRVRGAKVVFIRNREKYTSENASGFLRWKLGRLRTKYNTQVDTAQDFIEKVSAGSRVSGEPYVVKFYDGSRYPLKDILQNELDQLEMCLKAVYAEADAASLPVSTSAVSQEQNNSEYLNTKM